MSDTPEARQGQSHPDHELRDRELMERMRGGDEGALNALLELYWSPLVAHGARMLDGWDAAEDVAQETFVRIWRRREEWERDGSVRALLFRILHNLALDERKRRERRRLWSLRGSRPVPHVAMPDELLARSQLEQEFDRAVASLPERRREIFLHARVNGLSNREIADVMGIAPQTVANQLSAAVATIRSVLGSLSHDSPRSTTPTRTQIGGS